ncbi:bifunctional chorismate mutase/prephenate dehydrogenase [Pseudidiomarina mangrovi]|uniref:bifunctional chorismate mutase/prephenate dehydrogenase n=1 Tax=Pseudidiomarina mangrovi TaxID=2487133 RepID=UPI000FCC0557|nr:bifunctional chorismate mutase/prephenate dehydrogenase [Pseudidiomarina mangrovi]
MAQLSEQLQQLRQQIDAADSELVQLLLRRRELVAQVGVIKRAAGQPLYVPEREQQMLELRRQQAQQAGLSADLIEDVLRRVIRESYQQQQAADVHLQHKNIVVVGGEGALGRLFVRLFSSAGAKVQSLDRNDWDQAETICADADLVLFAVPITLTVALIERLPALPAHCILADLTSIKGQPLAAMLAKHNGPVVGLHPMFGPQQATLAKQLVIVCHGRQREQYQWLLDSIIRWGAHIRDISATEHDEAMGFIQVLRHLSTFVYGAHLAEQQVDLAQLVSLSSPIYRLELMMVGRLFAQNPELYADIILSQPHTFAMMNDYVRSFETILSRLQAGDKSAFIAKFAEVKAYFGDFSQRFLEDSQRLLDAAGDAKQIS